MASIFFTVRKVVGHVDRTWSRRLWQVSACRHLPDDGTASLMDRHGNMVIGNY
ncbi:MAG: hypothetical protein NC344_09360 [Bacteroidales bacterium]|nr:hypothetical protein [Bacteroidales bacterium]MCM1148015.1 hypothetical protein [Bacteroidales bacterium]MCM1206833.1 hypothetical protein [Bacillota bacterium]MCM1511029.1 hypothetical protein [Clostridium sp.]